MKVVATDARIAQLRALPTVLSPRALRPVRRQKMHGNDPRRIKGQGWRPPPSSREARVCALDISNAPSLHLIARRQGPQGRRGSCPPVSGLALYRPALRRSMRWMSESSYRGFPISIFIRRRADVWEVTTTIYAPEALVHELGDRVTMDVMQLPTNRIEQVRSDAFHQAKETIDGIVRDRTAAALPCAE